MYYVVIPWIVLGFIALVFAAALLVLFGLILFLVFDLSLHLFRGSAYFVSSRIRPVVEAFDRAPLLSRRTSFHELGSGDGHILRFAARHFPYLACVTGYELNPVLVAVSRFLNAVTRSRATVLYRDFFSVRLPKDSVIYFFLLPSVITSLEPKLTSLRRATVLSHGFMIPYLAHRFVLTIPGSPFSTYIYELP